MAMRDDVPTPLGWPEGSVRAVLALQIMLSFWLMVLLPDPPGKQLHLPLNLYFLLVFPFMFFVTVRRYNGNSDGTYEPHPLGLPPMVVRLLILIGTALVVGWQYYYHPEFLKARLTPDLETLKTGYRFGAALFIGFFIGYILRGLPGRDSYFFQFIHAWLSMIAMFMLVVEIIVHAFIEPSLEQKIDVVSLEVAITGIIACYYGTRS